MRIALVCPFDPFATGATAKAHTGGVERVFAEVARGLARRGHQVTVVASTAGASTQRKAGGIRSVLRRRKWTLFRAPYADLARHIPADAEVVHVAATYPFTTGPAVRRAQQLGIPVVLDFHFDPRPPSWVGRLAAWAFRVARTRVYRRADAVVVRSMAYARHSPSLAHVPRERLHVVPNGIDAARFTPDGAANDSQPLLFVGRLVPYKGLDVLLRALAQGSHMPTLLVVGDGPERVRLERLAARLGVDARFAGPVPDEWLPGLYRGARLTVLPSLNRQEAFGIVLLESMACGTPVLASDLPGVADVARVGGQVATAGDVAAWASALERALAGPRPDGHDLAARVHRDFSWSAVIDRLDSIYTELGRRPAGSGRGTEDASHANPGGHSVL